VEFRKKLAWLKDWRAAWVVGVAAGFVIGLLLFYEPWHLRPAYGDLATWLLVVVGVIGGFAALRQLRILQKQVSDQAERNVKRDELLDKQLKEAEAREAAGLRKQAEDVKASYAVGPDDVFGYVNNDSPRPITGITCNVMSKANAALIASPDSSAEVVISHGSFAGGTQPRTMEIPIVEQPGLWYKVLRPGERCRFTFDGLTRDEDHILVAWFTDDAGFRWQLDEYLHLVQAGNDDEYKW
jgi:hypothetical protein